MEFLPRTIGTRPRLACEIRANGVVAARAEDSTAVLSAVARVTLAGDAAGRAGLVDAVRKALEQVSLRSRDVTLVVPDAAVRVLLLDFDSLPAKLAEALPVVRFRLKKLLPFDADDAAVSYQVMATSRDTLQVLAVAMPGDVLAEYEGIVREAGFEPGAVLPSTLAALAGLAAGEVPALVVNAGSESVTTAIVKGGVLLLHRTVDLGGERVSADTAVVPVIASAPEDTSIAAIAARMAAAETGAAPAAMVETIVAVESVEDTPANEVAQAVSVASAYFEDTLESAPALVLAAGTLGADALTGLLDSANVGPVAVQEIVDRQMLGEGAASAGTPGGVPLGWLAGVRGALAN